jgi:hypothetical protein
MKRKMQLELDGKINDKIEQYQKDAENIQGRRFTKNRH